MDFVVEKAATAMTNQRTQKPRVGLHNGICVFKHDTQKNANGLKKYVPTKSTNNTSIAVKCIPQCANLFTALWPKCVEV